MTMHRFLFVKEGLAWPRSAGHDVHAYHMMRTLGELGHDVSLITAVPSMPEAVDGLALTTNATFADRGDDADGSTARLTWAQEKFRSYWGVDAARIEAVARLARDLRSDVVVVVGLEVLPYLAGVDQAVRVWYAADEWAWHHLSQLRPWRRTTWENLSQAAIKGLYERAYRSAVDRAWVVSNGDARAMRWVAGVRAIDIVPNGVDSRHYAPAPVPEIPYSCTFWGRLDFGPNIDALSWFLDHVWPRIMRVRPEARLTVFGFQPCQEILRRTATQGVELIPNLPDIRSEICRRQVVILPFISGGGIKNKLLEAASLARPIIASTRARGGLDLGAYQPFVHARRPDEWSASLLRLWDDDAERLRLGSLARTWVMDRHSWGAAARIVLNALDAHRPARKVVSRS